MTDWIEDGETGASVRAKLNALHGTPPSGDAPATDNVLHGQNASPEATGDNVVGGDVVIVGGLGQKFITVVDYTALAGEFIEVTVDGEVTGVGEGYEWTAATSNAATATSIAAAFVAPDYGPPLVAQAIGASVFIIPDEAARTIEIEHNAGDALVTTHRRDGTVNIYQWTDCLGTDWSTTTGLTYGFKAGLMHFPGGTDTDNLHVDAGTIDLVDNATNAVVYVTGFGVCSFVQDARGAMQGLLTLALVYTEDGEITQIDDLRPGLYATSGLSNKVISDFCLDSLLTSGLSYVCRGGFVITPNGRFESGGGFLNLTDDATNYVECDVTGHVVFNTTGFTRGNSPIATMVTSGGQITSGQDRRGFVTVFGPGPKHALVAGGVAGNITVTAIKDGDRLDEVIANTAGVWSDLTAEFAISADATINNTGGTNTTGKQLMVRWTKLTAA